MVGRALAKLLVIVVLVASCATTQEKPTAKRSAKKKPRVTAPVNDGVEDVHSADDLAPGQLVAEGPASFYADMLAGNKTASGERYSPEARTCAHRKLPFGTKLRITAVGTGKTSSCRVNDRGPFVPGRVLDVSKRVAK